MHTPQRGDVRKEDLGDTACVEGTYAGVELDLDALRQTLDDVRDALSRPSIVSASGAGLGHDRASVLRGLEEIANAASRTDLAARSAVAAVADAYQPEAALASARTVMADLDVALARSVEHRLGRERCTRLARLLRYPSPNLLGIFRKERDENAHTDLIAWLLDPKRAPHVAPAALHHLCSHIPSPAIGPRAGAEAIEEWRRRIAAAVRSGVLSVRREYVFGREWEGSNSLDRIDLVILGHGFTIAIENKVRAGEHNEQTRAYWAWLEAHRNKRHFNDEQETRAVASSDHLIAGLFLSPNGVPASCTSFQSISALDLVAALLAAPDEGRTETETVVLSAYLRTAASVMLRAEARAATRIGESA